MKTGKLIFGAVVIVFSVVAITIYYSYNKAERSVADENSIALSAEQLYQQYATNEQAANSLYLNRVIAVTGYVANKMHTEQGQDVVVLKSADPMFGTSCTLGRSSPAFTVLKPGDKVTLKGICTGFLTDVILIRGEFSH
jgi:tRNA_anti-like